ncbi:alpha-defensin 3-like [Sigmodon hispidus]
MAFLVQAEPLPEATQEAENKELPGVKNQDVSNTMGDPEASALQDAVNVPVCYCKRKSCKSNEHFSGICGHRLMGSVVCCR